MDFSRFLAAYTPDDGASGPSVGWTTRDTVLLLGSDPAGYTEFVSRFARASYSDGVLRFLLVDGAPSLRGWNAAGGWVDDWPEWKGRFLAFGYDWLGRQLGFDLRRRKGSEPMVAILEPGTAQLLEVPTTFHEFLTSELVDYADAALATGFYAAWRAAGGSAPDTKRCIGYKKPLFLGGADVVENLEPWDLAVYVSLSGQLAHKMKALQPIKGVTIE
jgi:hypothetical protein